MSAWEVHILPTTQQLQNRKSGENVAIICSVIGLRNDHNQVNIKWYRRNQADIPIGRQERFVCSFLYFSFVLFCHFDCQRKKMGWNDQCNFIYFITDYGMFFLPDILNFIRFFSFVFQNEIYSRYFCCTFLGWFFWINWKELMSVKKVWPKKWEILKYFLNFPVIGWI